MTVETDVKVLKSELSALTVAVERMSAKLDAVVTLQVETAKMQTEQRQHSEALERAFRAIGENRGRTGELETKVTKSMAFVRGAMFVGALLFGFVQWYALDKISDLKWVGSQLNVIDRRVLVLEQSNGMRSQGSEGQK